MNNSNNFKDMFGSITDYKKIVFYLFLIQNEKNLLKEIGFTKKYTNPLNLECRNILLEGHEENLDFVKIEEEPALEKFFLISKWKLTSILILKMLDINEVIFCC